MANDPKNPELGELSIDATVCAAYAVDLPEGGTVGMLPGREGIDEVVAEVQANYPTMGAQAGITELDFTTLMTAHGRVREIDHLLPAARKMVEILEETRSQQDDIRERTARTIAVSVETRARNTGNQAVFAKFQKTREYRSEIGVKAVKTRRKNAEEKKANGAPPAPPAPPAPKPADG